MDRNRMERKTKENRGRKEQWEGRQKGEEYPSFLHPSSISCMSLILGHRYLTN